MANSLTNNTEVLTNEEYNLIKTTNDERKVLKRFDVEELNKMFQNGASLDELADYCKSTVVNHFNYCTECNSFIDETDVISGTNYYKCPTCFAVNKL